MSIRGGIVSSNNDVELSLSVSGGKRYKMVYNDVVSIAIDKFVIISESLNKILISNATSRDTTFYIEQIKLLFQRAHVEFLQGELPFQNKYNIWLLDGYVRMLLETNNLKLIIQLLDLDSILYSIEEASVSQGVPTFIEFNIPSNLHVKTLVDINTKDSISFPSSEELSAYLQSLNNNLTLLTKLITENKNALLLIYKEIIKLSSTYLS